MFEYSGFEALLKQHYNEMGNFSWVNTSDFARIVETLKAELNFNFDSNDTIDDVISTVVTQLEGVMNDTSKVEVTKLLSMAASNLSRTIISSYATLRGPVKDLVSSLSEEVVAMYKQNLIADGAEVLIEEGAAPSVDFNIVNWGQLTNYNYLESLKGVISSLTGVRNVQFNSGMIQYINSKYPLSGFQDIEIHTDVYSGIIDQLKEKFPEYDPEELKDVTNVLFKARRYNGFCRNIKTQSIFWLLSRVELIKKLVDNITYVVDLSPETTELLTANLQIVRDTLNIAEFILAVKKEQYDNVLIIDRNQLNGPELRKFASSGGTKEDIAYHIRAFFSEIDFPMKGVPTQSVIEHRDRVNEVIQSKNDNIKLRMSVIKTRALSAAISKVLNTYLKDMLNESLPEGISKDTFYVDNHRKIKYVQDSITTTDNIEDALYRFVIDVWHDGTITEVLFKYLGREYVKIANESANVADDTLTIADTFVVSTILAEYFCRRHKQ